MNVLEHFMTAASNGGVETPSVKKPLPGLTIGRVSIPTPIIQGGMGVGVSGAELARAVSLNGGLGTLSSACIDGVVNSRHKTRMGTREAMAHEVREAKGGGTHPIAVNIMVALTTTYEDSVLGAMDGGADVIISGAGLPLNLPAIVSRHPRCGEVELVPIVSSGRAADLIVRRWAKSGRIPSAMVVEGPLAGGHLGWRTIEEIEDPKHSLDNLVGEVLEVSRRSGGFPVVAAGGIYERADIEHVLALGAAGVQLGTRFLATVESGASVEFKKAVVDCTSDSIKVAVDPGSPCQLPFRVLKNSGMYVQTLQKARLPKCDKGYLLYKGECLAKDQPDRYFCICNGLLSAAEGYKTDEKPLYTVGTNAARVDSILTVADLMRELTE